MLRATKVIRVWPDTKEQFDRLVSNGETADRVLNRLMNVYDNKQR